MARTARPVRVKKFPATAVEQSSSTANAGGDKTRITMVNFAAVHTDAVRAISEQYLQCRTLGHAWAHSAIARNVREKGAPVQWTQELACTRCPVTKKQVLSGIGEIVSTNYWYPPDYKFDAEGGPTRHDRAAMRMRIVKSPRRFV